MIFPKQTLFFLGFSSGLLLCLMGCRENTSTAILADTPNYLAYAPLPQRPAARLLFPKEALSAAPYLLHDPQEGYFEQLSLADIRLQWPQYPADTLNLDLYRQWLAKQCAEWPVELATQLAQDWAQVLAECETMFPGLAPDTIVLIAMQDAPYGAHIYFTRQAAVMLPITDLQTANKADLLAIYRHELFHLISRQQPEVRPNCYALANYEAINEKLHWESPLYHRRLTNPDAPKSNYALRYEGIRYLPLLYHPDTLIEAEPKEAFAANLRFTFLALAGDTVTTKQLPEWHARAGSEANSHYFIHPEEVMAEHFSLLLGGENTIYPNELEDLKKLLTVVVGQLKFVRQLPY